MLTKFKYLFVVAWLVFGFCQSASAELAAKGLVDSTNGFPSWYMDENGTALELCLDPTFCVFDPIVDTPFSTTIGFGENAFYWSADATLSGSGATGSLNMALVASFSGSTTEAIPADGEQITFFQIAVGPLTGLTAGSVYTVTHPFGVLENLVADASGNIPVQKQDIGCASQPCDFGAVLRTGIGPFLKWDPAVVPLPPTGFIGNPAVTHKVIGSPFGTNIFRIDGPNAGGTGVSFKQTDLFSVQGNLFTGTVPTPLVVDRATYTRPLPSAVNVIATSAPFAALQVSGTGITTTAMVGNGNGKFFAHIPLAGAPPAFVTVTANTTTTSKSEVVDVVTITLAEYNSDLKTLTIEASSSEQVTPPTLTAVGLGNLTGGKLTVTGIVVPPPEVTVVSTAGGSDTTSVFVTANVNPVARNDTAVTLKNPATCLIDVLKNDTALTGALDPATVTVGTPPANGGTSVNLATGEVTYTPNPGFVGKDSFKYTVDAIVDSTHLTSNVATVNITVFENETLTVTKAVYTTSLKRWQISGKSTVKSGNLITLYRGTVLTEANKLGTAKVSLLGGWSFSGLNSSVDPGGATQITAKSGLGTVVSFPLTIK